MSANSGLERYRSLALHWLVLLFPIVQLLDVTRILPGAEVVSSLSKAFYSFGVVFVFVLLFRGKGVRFLLTSGSYSVYLILSFLSLLWCVEYPRTLLALAGLLSVSILGLLCLRMDRLSFCRALLIGCDFIVVASTVAYLLGIGESVLFLQGVERLTGVTYGPHALARAAGVSLMLRLSLLYLGNKTNLFRLFFVILCYCFVIYKTDSRQVYAAVLLCLFVIWLFSANLYKKLQSVYVATLFVLILIFVFVDYSALFEHLTEAMARSESDSVTTLTGRTDIWEIALQKILESPVLGYGFHNGGLIISSEFETDYGWTTESAHNVFLQASLDLGFLGAFVLIVIMVRALCLSLIQRDALMIAFSLFVIIMGLVERSVAGAPGFLNLLLVYSFFHASMCQFKIK